MTLTRANWVEGLRVGFLYFIALFDPVSGRDSIHLLMTAGIAAALLRFGRLERRDHRDD